MINTKIFRLTIVFSLSIFIASAQKNKRISVEANYGLNGNFFVRGYDETGGPSPKTYFYKKNFIGPIGGVEVNYNLNERSALGIAYAKSVNSREIQFQGPFNTTGLSITDFKIRHTNMFYQLHYERQFSKKQPAIKYQLGLFYLRMNQQEISLENYSNSITIEERNFKNSKLEEGGTFAGIHYSKKIDTKFDLGIKSRIYFLLSTGTLEAITLTPTLTYHF